MQLNKSKRDLTLEVGETLEFVIMSQGIESNKTRILRVIDRIDRIDRRENKESEI